MPVSLGSAKPPLGFRQFQTIDLGAWDGSGAPGVLEDRHHPVAEALDDLAAARADLRLDDGADLARLVAGSESGSP